MSIENSLTVEDEQSITARFQLRDGGTLRSNDYEPFDDGWLIRGAEWEAVGTPAIGMPVHRHAYYVPETSLKYVEFRPDLSADPNEAERKDRAA